jgi:hypothetical protein
MTKNVHTECLCFASRINHGFNSSLKDGMDFLMTMLASFSKVINRKIKIPILVGIEQLIMS